VKTKAFGGTHPLRNEMTPEARALNRRVEMRILKDGSSKESATDL
jgi:outer membrane protein OmpA-like peptidoglycan-associated protein